MLIYMEKWMSGWERMTVGFYVEGMLDPLGIVVLWGMFLQFLLSLALGVVIAWIVHAVTCVMKKRQRKADDV